MAACTPQASYNLKSFFLDGVPDPKDQIDIAIADTLDITVDSLQSVVALKIEPEWNIHPPYREKRCYDCHLEGRRGQLKIPKEELCFTCHTGFKGMYKSMHGPFDSGNCTQCHNPHKSRIKSLLLTEKEVLCFNCHDEAKVRGYTIHEPIGDTECMTCHNPHGGENKFFLQSDACYQCHDSFEEKYTYVHGPVAAGGMCSQCHESHRSGKQKLLTVTGKQLCLSCHNELDIKSNPAHSKNKKQECTTCHSPHGSDQPYFLTKTTNE